MLEFLDKSTKNEIYYMLIILICYYDYFKDILRYILHLNFKYSKFFL